jgi:hypothetical protein
LTPHPTKVAEASIKDYLLSITHYAESSITLLQELIHLLTQSKFVADGTAHSKFALHNAFRQQR